MSNQITKKTMIFTIGDIHQHKNEISDFIRKEKENKKFTVIDVGADASKFNENVTDFIVDINTENSKTNFKIDICDENQWVRILDHVKTNGMFDYCICSHTLEDVYNPYLSLKLFPKIAKAGVIMVPHYSTELSNVENQMYLGYIHHRYIYKEKNGKIFIAPKMPFLEKMDINHSKPHLINFKIDWENNIDFEVFMNNYLGPTTHHIINNFISEFGPNN